MDRKRGHLSKDISGVLTSLTWVKMVGIGNAGVGKTSLIKHFCESKFIHGYQPTVGVDYGFKIENVNGSEVRVHLWDLAGSSDFLDVRNELYGMTDAIVLMFDVTNLSSFDALELWLKEVYAFSSGNPEVFLVGSKIDLKQSRVVSVLEARKFAAQRRFKYYETSAVTGEGINEMMADLLTAVLSKRKPHSIEAKKWNSKAAMETAIHRQKSAKR